MKKWLVPLAVGLGLRIAAALIDDGPFAADDYKSVIYPAWRWLVTGDIGFLSEIRSYLFPMLFYQLLRAGFVVTPDPSWALRIAYALLGILSSSAIYGAWWWFAPRSREHARNAAWLMAAFTILPWISTRALIECAAMVPLVFAMGMWERRRFAVSGLLFGITAMFRFQAGVLFFAALPFALKKGRVATIDFLVGGALAFGMQGVLDSVTHGQFFSVVPAYVRHNILHADTYGVSGWYAYAGIWLLLSLGLIRPLWRAARAYPLVGTLWIVFVMAHSFVGHKEERFMFTVLPLFVGMLSIALTQLGPRVRAAFWGVSTTVMLITVGTGSLQNFVQPLRETRAVYPWPVVARVGKFRIPEFYLGADAMTLNFSSVDHLARHLKRGRVRPHRVLFFPKPTEADVARLQEVGCASDVRQHAPAWPDALVAWINPSRNKRRQSRYGVTCE